MNRIPLPRYWHVSNSFDIDTPGNIIDQSKLPKTKSKGLTQNMVGNSPCFVNLEGCWWSKRSWQWWSKRRQWLQTSSLGGIEERKNEFYCWGWSILWIQQNGSHNWGPTEGVKIREIYTCPEFVLVDDSINGVESYQSIVIDILSRLVKRFGKTCVSPSLWRNEIWFQSNLWIQQKDFHNFGPIEGMTIMEIYMCTGFYLWMTQSTVLRAINQ